MSDNQPSKAERVIVVAVNCENEAQSHEVARSVNAAFHTNFVAGSVKNYFGGTDYYISERFSTVDAAIRAFVVLEQSYGNVELHSFWNGIHVAQNDALHSRPN